MRSTRLTSAIVAVCLVASTSCSDSTAPASPRSQTTPATPPFVMVSGMLHLGLTPLDHIVLTTEDGSELALVGPETARLQNLGDAEVDVRGTWSGEMLLVSDFLVRRVGGADVIDGILTVLYDDDAQTQPVGYGINLTRGPLVPLLNPPLELLGYVGDRVWVVAQPVNGEPTPFGIITPPIA